MYCVKCGVELGESERKCPLCSTPVYYPDADISSERPYPAFVKVREEFSPKGVFFVVSVLHIIAAVISVICDLSINSRLTWSGYVVGGAALFYVAFVLPFWFKRHSPAIFIPSDFAAVALYLLYISLATGGGWFLSFALPILGALALIVCSVTILSYYIRRGYLYIWGGASIALGLFCLLLELLINLQFKDGVSFIWSMYPCSTLFIIGMALIIIAIVKPFRESLRKIFAL